MTEVRLLSKLRKDARRIARRFHLRYEEIRPELRRVRRRYGSCDQDRVIRIRLYNLRNGGFLKYWNLINTLCHELAHVRYMDHRKKFQQLNQQILRWAKNKKIYCPNR